MLTLAEEVLLLALDDENGTFRPLPKHAMEFALTSAVLMDLLLARRLDVDLEQLMVVDPTPVGDDLLDPILAAIARSPDRYNARRWIMVLSQEAGEIRKRALARLVDRGVLRRQDDKLLWVLGRRRYPVLDDTEQREAKLRILGIVLGDDIPDHRDVVLVAVADAAGLFDAILTRREARMASQRIADVARMDLLGQALLKAKQDMREWGRWVGSPREVVWDGGDA
ncbi:MAG: GOLPH3/VPS74 family protein [Planctomycetota bacterium]